jgi:hypothetical protein
MKILNLHDESIVVLLWIEGNNELKERMCNRGRCLAD